MVSFVTEAETGGDDPKSKERLQPEKCLAGGIPLGAFVPWLSLFAPTIVRCFGED